MSDKDQFTFEDEDDNPKGGAQKNAEPQEPDPAGSEISFDTEEELPGFGLDKQKDAEDSDEGGETFFFDTEEDSLPGQGEQSELDKDDETSISEQESLFGDNLNAGFPDEGELIDDPVDFAPEPEPRTKSGEGSKNRTLLMVLLLLVVAAGGAYYFMGLGSSTPSVPTVQVPAEKTVKTVAVPPPPPAEAPAEKAAPVPEKPVTVTVPPPVVAKAEDKPVAAETKAAPAEAKVVPAEKPAPETVAVPAPMPAQSEPAPVVSENVAPQTSVKAVKQTVDKTTAAAKSATGPEQAKDGAYSLDAGSYLLESNRNALVAKIEKLGYQTKVTPVDATLDMTRLRLGTFSKQDVQASLDRARELEPGSYSVPAGDGYVIYAGTFLKTNNLAKVKERFLAEGLQVKSEPVQVVRTLSRIRFGRFATKEDAAEAASAVAEAGVKAVVVKAK